MDEPNFRESDGTISAFADQLRWETNPNCQEGLKRLLIKEEDRFGAVVERLDMVERNLAQGGELIARQRRLIKDMKIFGGDSERAERILENIEATQTLFEEFRDLIFRTREQRSCELRAYGA